MLLIDTLIVYKRFDKKIDKTCVFESKPILEYPSRHYIQAGPFNYIEGILPSLLKL